jgi:hypothetical protein
LTPPTHTSSAQMVHSFAILVPLTTTNVWMRVQADDISTLRNFVDHKAFCSGNNEVNLSQITQSGRTYSSLGPAPGAISRRPLKAEDVRRIFGLLQNDGLGVIRTKGNTRTFVKTVPSDAQELPALIEMANTLMEKYRLTLAEYYGPTTFLELENLFGRSFGNDGASTAATGEGGATGPSRATDSAAAAAPPVHRSLGTELQAIAAVGAEGSASAAASAGGAGLGGGGTGAGAATAEEQQRVAEAAALIRALDFSDPTTSYKRLQSPATTPPPSPNAGGISASQPPPSGTTRSPSSVPRPNKAPRIL